MPLAEGLLVAEKFNAEFVWPNGSLASFAF
jgi:hypothetical protein